MNGEVIRYGQRNMGQNAYQRERRIRTQKKKGILGKAHRREQVHMEMGEGFVSSESDGEAGAARKEIFGKDLRKAALIREAQEVKPR